MNRTEKAVLASATIAENLIFPRKSAGKNDGSVLNSARNVFNAIQIERFATPIRPIPAPRGGVDTAGGTSEGKEERIWQKETGA